MAGAPIMCGSEPVMGALENSTRNNHSSVGSSSDKCAFSNSGNSAEGVTKKNVQEFSHVVSNPSKEDIKQILRDELNIWTETSQNNERHRRVNRKFRSCNFPVHCGGTVFSKKPKLGR